MRKHCKVRLSIPDSSASVHAAEANGAGPIVLWPRFSVNERTGRRFRGLDMDPAYVDVALKRWSAMTGGTPHLDRAGLDE